MEEEEQPWSLDGQQTWEAEEDEQARERLEEEAYKARLRARRDHELSVQASTERAQLEADGQGLRSEMSNPMQQALQYEDEQWQLQQIGKLVWINSRSAGGPVLARVTYRLRKFWAVPPTHRFLRMPHVCAHEVACDCWISSRKRATGTSYPRGGWAACQKSVISEGGMVASCKCLQ